MTTDITSSHRRALVHTAHVVAAVRPDDLARPTPCAGWDVADLLRHLVSGNLWVPELVAGRTIAEVGTALDHPDVGPDPEMAFVVSALAADRALADAPAARPVALSYGTVTAAEYAADRFVDVLVHGWDLAAALDLPVVAAPDLVTTALALVEPQAAELRASGHFGAGGDVPRDADPLTRLLALLGRSPALVPA